MKNSCGSCKHMRAVEGKQNLQFHWPKRRSTSTTTRLIQSFPSMFGVWSGVEETTTSSGLSWKELLRTRLVENDVASVWKKSYPYWKRKGTNHWTRDQSYMRSVAISCHSACKFKPMTQDKPPRQRPTVDVHESNIHWINCLKIVLNKAWNLRSNN